MKKISMLALFAVCLVGCDWPGQDGEKTVVDQCYRNVLFMECLKAVPPGPNVIAGSNDWAEVIEECGRQSLLRSYKPPKYVKPECVGP